MVKFCIRYLAAQLKYEDNSSEAKTATKFGKPPFCKFGQGVKKNFVVTKTFFLDVSGLRRLGKDESGWIETSHVSKKQGLEENYE